MQKSGPIRKRFTPEEKQSLIEAFRTSGLTQRAFAAQSGLSLSCLSNWLRRSRSEQFPPRLPFIELPRAAALASSLPLTPYHVKFPGGLSLEMTAGFVPEEVARLCQILRRL